MDFILHAYVALWFASIAIPDRYGLLVGIRGEISSASPVHARAADLSSSLPATLQRHPERLLLWRPSAIYERMLAQQALLACSPVVSNPWGSFGPDQPNLTELGHVGSGRLGHIGRDLFAIAVPPSLKETVRKGSSEVLGYTAATLFPDVGGFSQWHASNEPFDWQTHIQIAERAPVAAEQPADAQQAVRSIVPQPLGELEEAEDMIGNALQRTAFWLPPRELPAFVWNQHQARIATASAAAHKAVRDAYRRFNDLNWEIPYRAERDQPGAIVPPGEGLALSDRTRHRFGTH